MNIGSTNVMAAANAHQLATQRRMQNELTAWKPEIVAAQQRYSGSEDVKWTQQLNAVLQSIDKLISLLGGLLPIDQVNTVNQYHRQAQETVQRIRLAQKIHQVNPAASSANIPPSASAAAAAVRTSASATATTNPQAAASSGSSVSSTSTSSRSSTTGGSSGGGSIVELDTLISRAATDRQIFVRSAGTIRRVLNLIEDPTHSTPTATPTPPPAVAAAAARPQPPALVSMPNAVAATATASHMPPTSNVAVSGGGTAAAAAPTMPRSYAPDAAPSAAPTTGNELLNDLTTLQRRGFRLNKAPIDTVLEFKVRSPVTIPTLEPHWPELIITIPDRARYGHPHAPPIQWRISTTLQAAQGVPEALDRMFKKAVEQSRAKFAQSTGQPLQTSVITMPILAEAWQATVNHVMKLLLQRYQQRHQLQQQQQRAAAAAGVVDGASSGAPVYSQPPPPPPSVQTHHYGAAMSSSPHHGNVATGGSGGMTMHHTSVPPPPPSHTAQAMLAPLAAMSQQQRNEIVAAARSHMRPTPTPSQPSPTHHLTPQQAYMAQNPAAAAAYQQQYQQRMGHPPPPPPPY